VKKRTLIASFAAGIAAWTGIGAAIAAGYIAYVLMVTGIAVGIWLVGWAVGLWMRGVDR
jgi:hypothetical protein